jgi:hypothetical protein
MTQAPAFWHLMMAQLFQVRSAKLRAALWAAYPSSQTLRYQLALCGDALGRGGLAAARVRRLSELLEPRYLLMAAEKIAPPGRPRPVEVRRFEEKVLAIIDRDGYWIWSRPQGETRCP